MGQTHRTLKVCPRAGTVGHCTDDDVCPAASHGEGEHGPRGPADASSTDLLMCCVLFNYNCFICRGLSYITIHRESIHGNSLCKSSCFQFNTTRGLTSLSYWSKCIVSFFWGFLQCFKNGLVCIYIKKRGTQCCKTSVHLQCKLLHFINIYSSTSMEP